jgi:hypothetical protein
MMFFGKFNQSEDWFETFILNHKKESKNTIIHTDGRVVRVVLTDG